MQPAVIQRLMRHTDIQATLNTYTSVFDEFKAKEIEKVNQYFLNTKMIDSQNFLDDYDEEIETNDYDVEIV